MKLTVHRGTSEIGGNCIEVATENSRIILDVGMPLFNKDREPRDTSALRRLTPEELLGCGILPKIPGLFESGPAVDAILLSHAHEDHTGLIRHSKPEIPIYASVGTSKMMLAGSKFAGQPPLPRERHRKIESNKSVAIGDFLVTAFSVDHSIYGSQAFLIEADGKAVLYSGDLRLHGRKPGMHRTLIESVKDRNIDVLLMEGTHIGQPDHKGPNEYDLEHEIADHIRSASGLVLASFSPQHVDRLVGFYRTTVHANRTFVPDAYTAFIMHLIASETPIPRPESAERIQVFFPKFFRENFTKKRLDNFYSLMSPARIGVEEIRSNPARYVMLFRPSMLASDFSGILPEGTRCLYSRWTGYLDGPDWKMVRQALIHAHGDLIEAHTSGHIYADHIAELVGQLNPKCVIPIHTFDGPRFCELFERVRLLADGESYDIQGP